MPKQPCSRPRWPLIGQRVRLPGGKAGEVVDVYADCTVRVRRDGDGVVTSVSVSELGIAQFQSRQRPRINRKIARLAKANGVSYAVALAAAKSPLKGRVSCSR